MKQRYISNLVVGGVAAAILFVGFPALLRMSMRCGAGFSGMLTGRDEINVRVSVGFAFTFLLGFAYAAVAVRAAMSRTQKEKVPEDETVPDENGTAG